MSNGRLLALFLAGITALRWSWGLARPLSPGESYLALCGFVPSLAYFDGPGGTPMLVALGISTAGPGGFGATFFWPLLAALASVALYFLVAALAGSRAALAAATLLNLFPVFNHAAIAPTCAMPLAAAALGTSLCAWRALERNAGAWWGAAGLCAAFGLFFTYTAWFLVPALALVLLVSHRWRPRLAAPAFWLAWFAPSAVMLLLLSWNDRNGWIHAIGGTWKTATSLDFARLPAALASSAMGLSPLVLPALFIAGALAFARVRTWPKIKFVALPALCASLAALYAALRGTSAQAPGLLAAAWSLPLLAFLPAQLRAIPLRPVMAVVFVSAALWSAFTLPRPATAVFLDAAAGRRISALRAAHSDPGSSPPFLVAESAPIAAALALALPDASAAAPGHPPAYTLESADARSQFDLWPRYDQFVEANDTPTSANPDPFTEQDGANPFVGRSALYITTQRLQDLPQAITAAFGGAQLLEEIPTADGRVLRIYFCSDYQTMPL
jgi:Dolichyl-phosphate-mannose-protein mannosyltransferase